MLTRTCDICGKSMDNQTAYNQKFKTELPIIHKGKGPGGSDIHEKVEVNFEVRLTESIRQDICYDCLYTTILNKFKNKP